MLRSILIGIDNTRSGVAAQRLGVRWARRCGATLVGLGVVDEPGIRAIEPARSVGGKPGVDSVYYMGYGSRLADVHKQLGQALAQFAARCDEAGVAHAEMKVVGSPHGQIEQEAQSHDLIVLARGSRFRFMAGDDEADETLKKVLKDAPRPIAVAPATTCEEGAVVIAYDGSLQAARALAAFQATGLGESGNVHVISVGGNVREAAQHAERACNFLSHHKIESVPHTISSTSQPADMILEQAGRLNAGLLVMGAYGQPVLREFFVGSATRKLFEESQVPLFLYH
jgi:nucleotide-binding universal stress UspA family protein